MCDKNLKKTREKMKDPTFMDSSKFQSISDETKHQGSEFTLHSLAPSNE